MASGRRRVFSAKRVTNEEPPSTDDSERDASPKVRWCNSGMSESLERRPSPRKKDHVPRHRARHRHDVHVKSKPAGRGAVTDERKASGGGGAFQLEPSSVNTGRGSGRTHSSGKQRQLREYGEGKRSSPEWQQEPPIPPRKAGSLERAPGREERAVQKEGSLEQFRRCEEKVSEAIQLWKEDRAGYHDLEPYVTSLWSHYLRVLEGSMERVVKEHLGLRVWRNLHYPVIEMLRRPGGEGTDEREGLELLAGVLEKFSGQYKALLASLQEKHEFQLEQLLRSGLDLCGPRRHRRMVMLALIPCHWCYLYLGDLSRYQQQLATHPNWALPRSYYLKAIQLAPKSGRSYNQLAVIAINAHRRLDAVYYYLRSLFAKNPVQSAHDSLVGLFEESSRKALKVEQERERERRKLERDAQRRKRREERRLRKKRKGEGEGEIDRHEIVFHSGHREVWVVPGSEKWHRLRRGGRGGGGERGGRGDGEGEGEVKEETVCEDSYHEPEEELVRHLTSAFLVVHGKLYTKIGIDEVEDAEVRLLLLWRRMLSGRLDLEAGRRLVKMTVINICSIHQGLKTSDSESGQKYYCNLAFHVALHLTRGLVDRCRSLLSSLPASSANAESGKGGEEVMERREEKEGGGVGTEGSCLADNSWSMSLAEDTPTSSTSDTGSEVTTEMGNVTFDLRSLSEDQLHSLEEVSVLLPAVRVWLDWVAGQEGFWLPFLSPQNRTDLGAVLVGLTLLVDRCLPLFHIHASEMTAGEGVGWAGLWEDAMLMGFMPLKAAVSTETSLATPTLYKLTSEQRRQQDLMRLVLLSRACKKLSGHAHSNEVEQETPGSVEEHNRQEEEDSGEDVEVEGYSEEEEEEGEEEEEEEEEGGEEARVEGEERVVGTVEDDGIERLKAQRERLSLEIKEQNQALTTAQTVLREAASAEGRETLVCARCLVPDTNCFVDQLASIRTLVECGHFVLAVPLVVMSELEGLSKGVVEGTEEGGERGKRVKAGAKLAVDFIRLSLGAGLQVLTTRGSLLQSLSFTAEVTNKASNDDLILQSSLSLHRRLDSLTTASDQPQLHTVVLLTDDRNLRVKAHAARLPVKDITEFMDISRLR